MKNKVTIPRWADRLIDVLLKGQQNETIKGDIIESFGNRPFNNNLLSRLVLLIEILSLVKLPIIQRNQRIPKSNQISLLRYNVRISLRLHKRYKLVSFINIFGISIGISSCLLVLIYIRNEINFDQFLKWKDQTYRINSHWVEYGENAVTPFVLGPTLVQDFPSVESYFSWYPIATNDGSGVPIKFDDQKFIESKFYVTDKAFLEIYNLEFVLGNYRGIFQFTLLGYLN